MEKYFHSVCKAFNIEILLLTAHATGRAIGRSAGADRFAGAKKAPQYGRFLPTGQVKNAEKESIFLSLLQNCLSSPNVSIGDMVFQVVPKADSPRRTVRTRFPLRIAAGMTELGLLQEPLLLIIIAVQAVQLADLYAVAFKSPLIPLFQRGN